MLDSWLQDLRYAVRLVRRNPIFSLTAALSLAIGIGANTTIFTVANALLLRPPAGAAEPERLVDIGRTRNGRGFDNSSYPNYLDVRARTTTLSDVYAYRVEPQPISLGATTGAERIYGGLVSANYFTTLGLQPAAGRLFTSDDDTAGGRTAQVGGSSVVVLSERFWRRRFDGDPSIVGRTVDLNGRPFTVVGVAPAGFQGTTILANDVWVPITAADLLMPRGGSLLTSRASVWLMMGARLKPGVTLPRAQAEIASIGAALEREFPDDNRAKGLRVAVPSALPGNSGPVAAFLSVLMAVVGLVLIIACVNLAGVLIARATARRREISVRVAIGAGRGRLIRHLLTETLVLFALGAAGGLALARVMTTALVALLPALPVPVSVALSMDGRVLVFTVVLSFVAAMLCGLAPAAHAARSDVVSGLKASGGGSSDRLRLRNAFIVAQVALTVVLVVGAGLFARALQSAAAIDPGFNPAGVEASTLDLSLAGYTDVTGPAFAEQVVERVRALPGVTDATLATVLPLGLDGLSLGDLTLPGETSSAAARIVEDWNVVAPHYFSTLGIPLMAGRDFDARDTATSPRVVIVNQTAARRFWPGVDPIGKVLVQWEGRPGARRQSDTLTVIGVARDAKYRSLGEDQRAFVYVPVSQQYLARTSIVARTGAARRSADIRALVRSMNPNLPIVVEETLEEHAALGLIPQRIAAAVSGSLGVVGLLLAAIGIYGVTAYAVTSRTREIGIRMALGATSADVVRMVLRQAMTLALGGVGIGVAAAAGASRLLGSLLFGIGPMDATAFGGAAALFGAIALLASYLPARRAADIAATEALRAE
jgi:predicted permease